MNSKQALLRRPSDDSSTCDLSSKRVVISLAAANHSLNIVHCRLTINREIDMNRKTTLTTVLIGAVAIGVVVFTLWMGNRTAALHVVSGAGASTLALATQYDYSSSYYDDDDDESGSFPFSLFIAAGLAFIPATIAKNKGRSFGKWWVYGWLLFIVALIHSLVISPEKNLATEPASLDEVD